MEAARTLQLRPSSVDVRDGSVLIDGLTVADRTLAELVERRHETGIEPEATVTDALEIGARVLDRESTVAEVDHVRREFERVSGEVERSFSDRARGITEELQKQFERFLGEDSGTMGKVLDAHSGELTELVSVHFGGDRNTAVQHQLREVMVKLLQESRQDLLRQFSAEDGHNPLAGFQAAVVREMRTSREGHEAMLERLTGLQGEIRVLSGAREAEAALAEERERGTGKGRTFEQRAFEIVEELAAGRGDVAHHVGDERSASGGKKGDIVIEIEAASGRARGRIALDAKDEKLSKNEAWKVLNAALEERDAAFAILLVASEDKVPSGRQALQEYEGNKMIVTLDRESFDATPVELAYRYARCRSLMTLETELQLDAPGVQAAADEALEALRDAQRIRSALTGASNSVEGARKSLDAMVGRVDTALHRIETLAGAS
jgi:hypothetical protein